VHPRDLDAVGLQALQAVFDRAQRGVVGVVVDDPVGSTVLEHLAFLAEVAGTDVLDFVQDQAADLGADDIGIARLVGQRVAHADFRQAGTVERRVVEVADAVVPSRIDGRARFRFRNVAEHVAERGGTETELAGEQVVEGHDGLLGFGVRW